jgi:hypothetical protein
MIPDGTCKALDESGATQQQTCISGAYTLMAMHLIGVHLIGVYLIGVYLIGMHLMGMHLMGMHLIGMYLMGMHPKGVAKSQRYLGCDNWQRGCDELWLCSPAPKCEWPLSAPEEPLHMPE